ncbi:MAG TPA: amidohydrolase family protein [Candidatus Acidoferrum sp.]|nr:amidohydrolase family protein [Candidatus Acidoferrum sp.]
MGSESTVESAKRSALPPAGKIALEEHFVLAEAIDTSYAVRDLPLEIRNKILDIGSGRIADMDRGGLDICILSLTAPGVQAVPNVAQAIAQARRTNDYLADHLAKNPKRLKGFATLPLQDPEAAARELTRCVRDLGFCGALVNGFSQVNEADSAVFYDLPQYRRFWATVQELDVPFYLHPRDPLESRQQAYEGYPWLAGSPWGFAVETSIHALRLMASGLFDEYPKLKVILGHLGEGLPFSIWRVDHRLSRGGVTPRAKLPMSHYLRENFYITTSGNFRTQALTNVILEVGADRILYSVDYPYEDVVEASEWFDHASISESDRVKIARTNAQKLFRL